MMKFHLPSSCEVGILLPGDGLNHTLGSAVGTLSLWQFFSTFKEW